jgi:hypothetical protein
MGHIVECHWDHVRLLNNLLDGTTLALKIVVSSIFLITEILAIEDHKLDITFLYVAFKLESQLVIKPALIPIKGPNKATEGG